MKLIITLTAICIISALLLGFTYDLTSKKIKLQEETEEKESVNFVLPNAEKISSEITGKKIDYYEGYDSSNKVVGYAFVGSGKGYSSAIRIMIGIDNNMDIQKIKILSQQETPGLGDKVTEVKSTGTIWDILRGKKLEKPGQPWFQGQFDNKSVSSVNEIKFITGATITSKAVLKAVKDTIEEFEKQVNPVRERIR